MTNAHYIFPDWPAPSTVKAACTTRTHGASQGAYAGFNLGRHVGDEPEHVAYNRQQLQSDLQLPQEPVWLEQVHGSHVIIADCIPISTQADAAIARQADTVCVVLTADCLPILLCNEDGSEVAAIHAGWRGLAANIIASTIQRLDSRPSAILAWLGPAISSQHYEVGEEVYHQFPTQQDYFQATTQHKWLMDIYALAKQQLQQLGITKIYGGGFCTYTDSHQFYSYRRDGAKTGRMASLIWLTSR